MTFETTLKALWETEQQAEQKYLKERALNFAARAVAKLRRLVEDVGNFDVEVTEACGPHEAHLRCDNLPIRATTPCGTIVYSISVHCPICGQQNWTRGFSNLPDIARALFKKDTRVCQGCQWTARQSTAEEQLIDTLRAVLDLD